MDQIQQVMLHYRDAEGITFYLCVGAQAVRLGAKADIGDRVGSSTWKQDGLAPGEDPTRAILGAMLAMVTAIRRERRLAAPPDPMCNVAELPDA